MNATTAWLLTGALLLGASAPSQEPPSQLSAPSLSPVAVPFGYRIAFPSKHLGETRDVFIRLPQGYDEVEGPDAPRYPVLYVLDGGDYFESFAGVAEFLAMYEAVPEMIVVAVPHDDRLSELTFTPANEEYGNWPTSGGAEAFHRFLEEELIPALDDSYRTHPFRILAGHSLGGLFAIESMARSPNLFQATIAMSPTFIWNQFEWLDMAEAMFDGLPSWKHFLLVSEEPKDEEHTSRVQEFGSLVEAKAPAGFEYWHERFPGENHGTVALPALYKGLKQLFDGWSLEGEAWDLGPEKVNAHFQGLSDRYGFAVPIPEDYLVGHALHGLQRHEAPDEAIALLELCLSLYPDSADAYEALGEAYEWRGETEKAEAHYLKALEIDPGHELAKDKLEALKGASGHTLVPLPQDSPPLTVWYLGHCGFAVQVGEKLLVFDYQTTWGTPAADSSGLIDGAAGGMAEPAASDLSDGFIEPADLEGLDVYAFVSHSHADHFDSAVLEWEEEVDGITYFFGWQEGDNPEHHYFVEPRSTAEVDGIEVYTIYSHHDTVPEVAYLVHVDGRWIYHNGDYLQDYIPDFQYLESLTDHIDVAFTAGSHDERWQYTHQAHYLLEHFQIDALFPMHFGDSEEEGEAFARIMAERGYDTHIPVPRRRGDRWVIGG